MRKAIWIVILVSSCSDKPKGSQKPPPYVNRVATAARPATAPPPPPPLGAFGAADGAAGAGGRRPAGAGGQGGSAADGGAAAAPDPRPVSLTNAQFDEVIGGARSRLEACAQGIPSASVSMRIRVVSNGSVSTVTGDGDPGLVACLTGVLTSLSFPAFKADWVEYTVPVRW